MMVWWMDVRKRMGSDEWRYERAELTAIGVLGCGCSCMVGLLVVACPGRIVAGG